MPHLRPVHEHARALKDKFIKQKYDAVTICNSPEANRFCKTGPCQLFGASEQEATLILKNKFLHLVLGKNIVFII